MCGIRSIKDNKRKQSKTGGPKKPTKRPRIDASTQESGKSKQKQKQAGKAIEQKPSDEEEQNDIRQQPSLRIVYPTNATVNEARFNGGAGFLTLQSAHWNNASYPRSAFHDARSANRPSLLLHSKVIVRLLRAANKRLLAGWIYVGSHNLSGVHNYTILHLPSSSFFFLSAGV